MTSTVFMKYYYEISLLDYQENPSTEHYDLKTDSLTSKIGKY